MFNLETLCVSLRPGVKKGLTLGSAPLYTDGWQRSLCASPSPPLPRQTAMCKCLSSPSQPMTSIDFLWGGAGAIHQQALAFAGAVWHRLSIKRQRQTTQVGFVAESVTRCFLCSERLERIAEGGRAVFWIENTSFDRKSYVHLMWSSESGLWILIYLAGTLRVAGGQGRIVIPSR